MDIFLIRHAQARNRISDHRGLKYDHPDPELSEEGVLQAGSVGERLRSAGVSVIYTSDLRRTRQTAEIINESLKAKVEIREELREINMGKYEKKSWAEIEREDPDYYREWLKHLNDLPYPDGESGADVARRCEGVISEIINGGRQNAVVVTHGGTLRILLCYFLGIGYEKRFFLGEPIENCSISQVKYDEVKGAFCVHSVNDTGHLRENERRFIETPKQNPSGQKRSWRREDLYER